MGTMQKKKLNFNQIDRAIVTLEYLSARTKNIKGEDGKANVVPNPATFGGQISWDLAANETELRAVHTTHQKARKALFQKHTALGMKATEPSADFLKEQNDLDFAEYEVKLVLIPVDELRAEKNEIPNTYRSALMPMITFAGAKKDKTDDEE